jgi:Flp pilus assembly protein TadD
MKSLKNILWFLSLIIFVGCASSSEMKHVQLSEEERIRNEKAYDHYFQGVMLDFQDQYDKALIEYYQALLYDSTSAQINKAIARNQMRLQNYESSLIHLKRSFALNPKDKETLNYLAEAYYNLNNHQESIYYYSKLLEIDPYNETVQNNLIFLYSHLKKDQDLSRFYWKMMGYYPGDSKFAIQYALVNIRLKNITEAQKVLEDVIERDSTEIEALQVLGNIYEINRDTVNALQTYKIILDIDPTNEENLTRIYRILRFQGNWEEIERIYSTMLTRGQESPQVRLILAETYYFQDKDEQAKAVLNPVLQEDNFRLAAYEILGRIAYENENFSEAESLFIFLTQDNPENRFGWLFLALIYNQQNEQQMSIKVLKQALTIHRDDPDLLAMYGSALSQTGQDQEAIKPLERALEQDRENIATISSIAAVYDKLQMWNKSDSLYNEALKREPRNALLLNNYSYSLSQRNIELEKALEMVTLALEIDPDNGAYLDTKGWIYYQLKDFEKALFYIQKALDSREESAEVLEHMGDVYYQMGEMNQAKIFWQRALEKDPKNSELAQKIKEL